MPFLVLVRGAFVNAGGTARFNPQISRQMSWVRVYRKRIEGYFAASASFEKKSVLFKVLDTDLNRHFDCTVPCKGPEQLCITGPKNTHEGSGTNSP